jgi:hypothetical protein
MVIGIALIMISNFGGPTKAWPTQLSRIATGDAHDLCHLGGAVRSLQQPEEMTGQPGGTGIP